MSTATASGLIGHFYRSGTKVQKDLDIGEYTDPEHNPMIPHVMSSNSSCHIQGLNGSWFFAGPTIEELRQDCVLC